MRRVFHHLIVQAVALGVAGGEVTVAGNAAIGFYSRSPCGKRRCVVDGIQQVQRAGDFGVVMGKGAACIAHLLVCGNKTQNGQVFRANGLPLGNLQRAELQHTVALGRECTHLDRVNGGEAKALFEVLLGKVYVAVDKPAFNQRVLLGQDIQRRGNNGRCRRRNEQYAGESSDGKQAKILFHKSVSFELLVCSPSFFPAKRILCKDDPFRKSRIKLK